MNYQPKCRFCGSLLDFTFIDLGMQPLCQDHVKPEELRLMEPHYPLHPYLCKKCFLVQIEEVVPPHKIFDEYAYFSSYSESWLKHAENYADYISKRFSLDRDSFIVEIASNDGYLLQYFLKKGFKILGVEPSKTVAKTAIEKRNIPTEIQFFNSKSAVQLKDKYEKADVLIGNNVLAHVPDLNDFIQGLKLFLKDTGIITMEFPHLLQLIKLNQFDTIYHEHYSYFSFTTVHKIFNAFGLELFDVEELPSHGGSIRIFVKHTENKAIPISASIKKMLDLEIEMGIMSLDYYEKFKEEVKETKRKLLELMISLKRKKKSIIGYGAPGKGNTLLNYCGIRTDMIDYTVDKNPFKQNNFLPGTLIPIFNPDKILETKPDYILILPWNLKKEIISQLSYVKDWGCKFIIPIPEIEIV